MRTNGKVPRSRGLSRMGFLKSLGGIAGGAVAGGMLSGCAISADDKKKKNTAVRWGMIIDRQRCVGCKACAAACKAENHTPPGVAYNLVLEEESGEYPHVKRSFLSRPCMQCAKSSCVKVCPTKATHHRDDGVVVVDYDKCIGCRYCISACPYGARSFDYGHNYDNLTGDLTPHEKLPSPEYGENRLRAKKTSPIGNVRKCMFCIHRVTKGLPPACAATCMAHAIHFGNLHDPKAVCMLHGENLQELLTKRSSSCLKAEIGNEPAVYYLA